MQQQCLVDIQPVVFERCLRLRCVQSGHSERSRPRPSHLQRVSHAVRPPKSQHFWWFVGRDVTRGRAVAVESLQQPSRYRLDRRWHLGEISRRVSVRSHVQVHRRRPVSPNEARRSLLLHQREPTSALLQGSNRGNREGDSRADILRQRGQHYEYATERAEENHERVGGFVGFLSQIVFFF